MRFSLAQLTRRQRNPRRSTIVMRDIIPTGVQATDLYGIYRPVLDRWAATIAPLMAEYERTLATMTTDSPADLNATLDAAEGEIQRLLYLLTPRLRDWVLRVERWQRGKWIGAVLSATGVDLQTLIGPEDVAETLEAVIERNVGLIKSVSGEARQRMGEAVFRGLTERTPAREVAADLRQAVDMGQARARRIASDQLTKVTSSLADERRRQAAIDHWKWRHSGKLHPRADHVARNGKVYTDADAPPDRPGQLPFCGCRAQAVLKLG